LTRKAIDIRMQEPQPEDCPEASYKHRKTYWDQRPGMKQLAALKPFIKGRVAMIFTDEFVGNLKPRVEGVTIPSKAKVGQIAPVDVTIFKGPTGMDP